MRKLKSTLTRKTNRPDYVFLILVGLIVIVGLIFLTSATSVIAYQKYGDTYYYLKRQLLYGLLPGLALFTFFSRYHYQNLRRFALPILLASVALLAAVFIPGLGFKYGGAQRWIHFGGLSFQPSEFIKLTFLIYLAAWFEARGPDNLRRWRETLLPFVLWLGLILGLVLLQKDLGTASVIVVSAVITFFVAGASITQLAFLTLAGLAATWWLIVKVGYRAQRLTIFLQPNIEPQGAGYHITQALLAVGSGGFWGLGLGYSRQKYQYLPQIAGDSIFAIIAEELGFIFTAMFIILIISFLWRGFKIARAAPDPFARYLAAGILSWLAWQICVNMASMLNILPLTGIPLPFVSSGGTALMTALAAIGILTNISRQTKSFNK